MSGMTTYFIRRLMLVPLTFLAITFMVYSVLRVVPGGPIEQAQAAMRMAAMEEGGAGGGTITGEADLQIDEEAMDELKRYYALDRSIPVGYLQWLGLWRREMHSRVPAVPADEFREDLARLKTTREAQHEAETRLTAHLEERGLVYHKDGFFEPLEPAEMPGDLRARADLLRSRSVEPHYPLQKLLADEGMAFADGNYLRRVDAGDDEFWVEAHRLAKRLTGTRAQYDAIVEETGHDLLADGRLIQREFIPLHRLKEAQIAVSEQLQGQLAEQELIEFGGRIYQPISWEDLKGRDERLAKRAEALAEAGFARRDRLLSLLAAHDLTWQNERYYETVGADLRQSDPERYETLEALIDSHRLATTRLERIEREHGYAINDQFIVFRIKRALSGILQLDFGRSYTYGEPVLSLVASRFEVSLWFGLTGFFLTYLICIPLGIIKAIKHRTTVDTATSIAVFLGYAMPGFVVSLILLAGVAVHVEWLPLGGHKPEGIEDMGWLEAILGRARHMLIPVIGYMVAGFAAMTILMKNSLLDNLGSDYVRTAFAKGLRERRVVFVHALRNSLIPITAGLGSALALLFAGSFLIETTCNIDGMGFLGYQAIVQRDYPITLGVLVFLVLIQLFGNIISDLIWATIDPRIRFGAA